MNRNSSSSRLIKVLIVLFITIGVVFCIYFVNARSTPIKNNDLLIQSSSSQSPQASASPIASPTPKPAAERKVYGGQKTAFFSPYQATINSDWQENSSFDTTTKTNKLVFSKGKYLLSITQTTGGVGVCIFPGEAPVPMSRVFISGTGINGVASQFMRGSTDDKTTYEICESKGNAGYSIPTEFGYITYTVPQQQDPTIIQEMDAIIASLTVTK